MICSVCGEDKKIFCKQMCQPCYFKQYVPHKPKPPKPVKPPKPTICKRCNRDKPPLVKGLCKSCYRRLMYEKHGKKDKFGICIICGRESVVVSKGRCSKCYQRVRTKEGYKKPPKTKYCKVCEDKAFKLNLCQKHYDEHIATKKEREAKKRREYYQQNKERSKAVSKAYHDAHKEVYAKRTMEWNKANPDKARERLRVCSRNWYERNKNNPEFIKKTKERNQKRYAKKKENRGK